MDCGRENQIIKSIIWNGMSVVVNYVVTLWLTHYLTENVGAEAYGFVSIARNFSSYAALATVALNSYAARFISIAYHQGEIKRANQFYSSVVVVNLLIGSLMMLLSTVLIVNLEKVLVIPAPLVVDVKWLFAFMFLHFFITSVSTAFTVAPIIKNRMDLSGIIKCLSYFIEAVCLITLLLIFPPNVLFVGVGMSIAALMMLCIYYLCTKKLTPKLKVNVRNSSWTAIKELVTSGIWNTINSIGNILNSGLDLLITNLMLSALEMGQFAIVKTVSTVFYTLFSTVSQPFQPLLLKHYANNDMPKVVSTMQFSIKVCGMFSNIVFAGFFALGTLYYQLWVPSQDGNFLHILTVVTILATVIEGAVYPIYYTYTLTLKNRIPCFVTIAAGVFNVLFAYVLLKFTDLGLMGIAGKTVIVSWIVNFIFNPIYAAKCLGIKSIMFYNVLLRHIISCVVMTVIFKWIASFAVPSTWVHLIILALVMAVVGVVIHVIFLFNKDDFKSLKLLHRN